MPQPLDPLTWLGITAAITAAYTAAVILSGRRVEAEAAAEEAEAVEELQLPPIETLAEPPPPTPKPEQPPPAKQQAGEKELEKEQPQAPPQPQPSEEEKQREEPSEEPQLEIELLQEPEPLETMLTAAENLRNELERLAALLKEGRVN